MPALAERARSVKSKRFLRSRRIPSLSSSAGFDFVIRRWLTFFGASDNFDRLVSCVRLLFCVMLSAGMTTPLVFDRNSGHIGNYEI